ncbi:DUF6744 family protein [Lysinibacillus sp. 1P01SD]|uniref:DUF6744 family protein n=1 Tax=Lysinibacillus sp. 1P01SD TaxID=3132285 RepID=UPI0039A3483C
MVKLDELVIVTDENEQNQLGFIFWYSVGQQIISTENLRQKAMDAGIEEAFLPKEIRISDAFRRATKEAEYKITVSDNLYQNILIREVHTDKDAVVRNVVIETVDKSGKKLDYIPQAGTIYLRRNDSDAVVGTVIGEDSRVKDNGSLYEHINRTLREVRERFELYKTHHSAQQIRDLAVSILKSCNPIPLKKHGSIYFIPFDRRNELLSLIVFLESLDNANGYKVDVMNKADNRKMVSNSLMTYIEDLNEKLRDPKMDKGQMKKLAESMKNVLEKQETYKAMLSDEEALVETKMLVLQANLANLETRIVNHKTPQRIAKEEALQNQLNEVENASN